jgi:hypothetical protein
MERLSRIPFSFGCARLAMTACNSALSYKSVPADVTMIRATNTRFVIVNLN